MEIAGLNCNGNPLHPDPVIGSKHAEDVRRSIRLANRLGQHRVVTMSGLPAGEPMAGGQLDRQRVELWRPRRARPVDRRRGVLARDRPRGGATSTSRWRSSCTRRIWCSTQPACASSSSALARPISASSLTPRTCSGSGWTRWPWPKTSARWCSMPPRRTYASTRPPLFTVCSTTGSAGWVRTSRVRISAATNGPTSGRRTPRGTSCPRPRA